MAMRSIMLEVLAFSGVSVVSGESKNSGVSGADPS
jgi:hypothetical protein